MTNSFKYEINNRNPENKKRFIRNLFDLIAQTYDLLNHILSFGMDFLWRKYIFRYIPNVKGYWAIDLCCGTGDLSLLLYKHGAKTVSLDFSLNMLKKGIKKQSLLGYNIAADVSMIPFADNAFNIATIAFGIRNIPDIDNFILEVHRVLMPGGRLVILELVSPANKMIKKLYSVYLNILIPIIGGFISGKVFAYKYLSKTIESFIHPYGLEKILRKYGFTQVFHHPQTFGVATIIVTQKWDK